MPNLGTRQPRYHWMQCLAFKCAVVPDSCLRQKSFGHAAENWIVYVENCTGSPGFVGTEWFERSVRPTGCLH